jgi:hypothetical protein
MSENWPDKSYNVAYTDASGRDVRFVATLIGPPEPINPRVDHKRLQISNFRTWPIGADDPLAK